MMIMKTSHKIVPTMKRKLLLLNTFLVHTMKTILTGAALTATMLATSALAEGGVIKFGHDNKTDPFENPAHACTAVFSNLVNSGTNGSVTVEVFGSNQLGSAAEHVQQVRDGIIQATLTSTGALASYYPRIDVLNLPFAS